MSEPRILALVPTISPGRVRAARPWIDALRTEGVDVRIVANAASVAAAAAGEGPGRVIDTRANPGFARCLTAAVRSVEQWEWVVLLNDDLVLDGRAPALMREAIADAHANHRDVLYFDPEPLRPLPGRASVFASLSLLEPTVARLRRRRGRPERATSPGGTYKSFSAVAISRSAWTARGGLDERFVFCFEDAFFVREHVAGGGAPPVPVDVGIRHDKSTTTGRHIARVLPAIAYSARTYLEATGTRPRVADGLVVAALLLRVPLTPFASAPTGPHLRGIAAAVAAVTRRREPALPAYELL